MLSKRKSNQPSVAWSQKEVFCLPEIKYYHMFYEDISDLKMLNKLIELGPTMWTDQGGV